MKAECFVKVGEEREERRNSSSNLWWTGIPVEVSQLNQMKIAPSGGYSS